LDGFIAAFVAFAITLVVAFVIQMFKVVPKRYFEEKDRADTAIHELTERTTPKFGVYFDQDRCGIVSAIERAPIVSTGIYGSARITEGQAFHALYIRICVNAASHVVVRNCQAFLLSLEKQQNPNETFIYINLPHPIQLTDKPFDVCRIF